MKKYIPLVLILSVLAGCSSSTPAAHPNVHAETAAELTDPLTEAVESTPIVTTVTEAVTSFTELMQSEPESTPVNMCETCPVETQSMQSAPENTEPVLSGSPEEEPSQAETTVIYENGSPRFNDPEAVKDIELSETRRYVYTDDEGENGCAPGEVTYYAAIPVGENMPERIELIDIDRDIHVGYMYDDGDTGISGDVTEGDGIYSIKIVYDLDIDTDPDVSETWSRCYFALYTDPQGINHTCQLPTFVNIQEPVTEKETEIWTEVERRINEITSSSEYKSASTDEKEKMLLRELDILADEGLVYEHLTRTNDSPRNVVFKIVKGPTMIIELEPCICGYGYDDEFCDDIDSITKDNYDLMG